MPEPFIDAAVVVDLILLLPQAVILAWVHQQDEVLAFYAAREL
jgi:hypothetical protein